MNLSDLGQTESGQGKEQEVGPKWSSCQQSTTQEADRQMPAHGDSQHLLISSRVLYPGGRKSPPDRFNGNSYTGLSTVLSMMWREHSSLEKKSCKVSRHWNAPGDPSDTDTLGSAALRAEHRKKIKQPSYS